MTSWARYIARVSSGRKPSLIREMTKLLSAAPPGIIPLSGGLPNPEMFPFAGAQIKTKDGVYIDISVLPSLLCFPLILIYFSGFKNTPFALLNFALFFHRATA